MNEALRHVCRGNLLMALEKLKLHADPGVAAQAAMAEVFFLDFESAGSAARESHDVGVAREVHDSTDYGRYQLLHGFGLSPRQLIDIAVFDGLHELRVIRMLRLTCALSLDEARQLISAQRAVGKL